MIGKSKRPQFILGQTATDKMNDTLWPDADVTTEPLTKDNKTKFSFLEEQAQ